MRAEKNTLVRVMEFIHLSRPISSEAAFLLAFCSHADASPLANRLLNHATAAPAIADGRGAGTSLTLPNTDSVYKRSEDDTRNNTPDQLDRLSLTPKPASSRAIATVVPAGEGGPAMPLTRAARQASSISGTTVSAGSAAAATLSPPQQAMRLSQAQSWMVQQQSTAPDTTATRGYESEIVHWVGTLASANNDKQLLAGQNRKSNIISPARPLSPSTAEEEAAGVAGEFSLPSPFVTAALQFQRDNQTITPLPGPLNSEQVSLDAMLLHPACVEILKDELQRIHSAENLAFYLLVTRFQRIKRSDVRQWLGGQIVSTYIVEGAAQQINITSRQTAEILQRHKGAHYPADMFAQAAREVKMLIGTNLKQFRGSVNHRLCCWILQASALDEVRRASAADMEEVARSESRLLDELEADVGSRAAMSDSGQLQKQGENGEGEFTRNSVNSKSITPLGVN